MSALDQLAGAPPPDFTRLLGTMKRRQILGEIAAVAGRPRPTVERIQAAVAERFDLPVASMTGARRAWAVARPRQVAMFLARRHTRLSLPQIGRRFGGRDHSTVFHAIRQVEARCAQDSDLAATVTALSAAIDGSGG